jgi:hypothetical protein
MIFPSLGKSNSTEVSIVFFYPKIDAENKKAASEISETACYYIVIGLCSSMTT